MQTFNDNIFQEFKLYIEGVQVPFINISINQGLGSLPTASISIPPQIGLMDIARFYQPKVHVFFTERHTGEEKVLFTGIITATSYMKSKEGNGNMGISFECVHRYNLITECLVDYCGYVRDGVSSPEQGYPDQMNSAAAIQEALNGWTEISPNTDSDYSTQNPYGFNTASRADILPSYLSSFSNRLKGMPGVFINFWNQLTRASYHPKLSPLNGSFKYIYKPLVEDGLQFFKRLSGHMLIEKTLNSTDNRQQSCVGKSNKNIIVPPCNQLFLRAAIQANLAVNTLHSYLQNSNEVTNLYQIFQTYYQTLDYDILTLSCPAEVVKDPESTSGTSETYAVDTIVKPSMPFYFSPTCNILYPSMYTSIRTSYDEVSMPTRIDVLNNQTGNSKVPPLHYRSPNSIRSSIANKNVSKDIDLAHTKSSSLGAIGQYEMGRGIKCKSVSMPEWLGMLFTSKDLDGKGKTEQLEIPADDTAKKSALDDLKTGWKARYGDQPKMNPFDPESGIPPHERILFSTADYYFTKEFASTKAGSVSCLFNPYIIPGYPMDILEASPNLPSFHAMCASVTHSITDRGVSTQVNFVAAMTYTELANYYIPFINPYLQVELGLAKNPTLVNTDDGDALRKANEFYRPTLGVTGVSPEMLFNFTTGMTESVKMSNGILTNDGRPLGDHSSEEDLLLLCSRPIESKQDFADRFEIKYIDLIPQNYSATGVKYVDPKLDTGNITKFEIGQSQFLEYTKEVYEAINKVSNV